MILKSVITFLDGISDFLPIALLFITKTEDSHSIPSNQISSEKTNQMISPVRFVCVNDDHKSFTCVLHDKYCVFECSPFQFLLPPTELGLSIGTVATCNGHRFLAVNGLPADPDFDTRNIAVFDHEKEGDRCIFRQEFSEHVLSMKITPAHLAVAFHRHVELWDLESGAKLKEFPTAVNVHAPLDASRDSRFFAFTGQEALSMSILDLSKSQLNNVRAADDTLSIVHFSNDGKLLATASADGKIIRVFDTTTRGCIGKFKRGTTASLIHSIEFSPDNHFMVIVSQSGTLHFFDLQGHAPSNSPPTLRSMQKASVKQNVVSHLIWSETGLLSIVMMDGEMINMSLDERTLKEIGTEQITFISLCEV